MVSWIFILVVSLVLAGAAQRTWRNRCFSKFARLHDQAVRAATPALLHHAYATFRRSGLYLSRAYWPLITRDLTIPRLFLTQDLNSVLLWGRSRDNLSVVAHIASRTNQWLAVTSNRLGYISASITHAHQSVQWARLTSDSQAIGGALNCLGSIMSPFDADYARKCFLEDFSHRSDPSTYLDLAKNSIGASEFAGALEYLEMAERLSTGDAEVDHKSTFLRVELFLRRREYSQAESLLDSMSGCEDSVISTGSYPELMARLLLETGRGKEANTYLIGTKLLAADPMMPLPQLAAETCNFGWCAELVGDTETAVDRYLRSVDCLERLRLLNPEGLRLGFLKKDNHLRPYKRLVALLARTTLPISDLDERGFGRTNREAALFFADAARARVLLEQVAARSRPASEIRNSALVRKERRLRARLLNATLATEAEAVASGFETGRFDRSDDGKLVWRVASAPKEYIRACDRRTGIEKELRACVKDLVGSDPGYASTHYPIPIAGWETTLRPNEVVIEYALSHPESYAFVISKDGIRDVVEIAASDDLIRCKIKGFVEAIVSEDIVEREALGSELFNLLLSPAITNLDGAESLVMIPDTGMWGLAFGVLPVAGRVGNGVSTYVGDRWPISYHASLSSLRLNRTRARVASRRPFFGLGNPAFGPGEVVTAAVAGGIVRRAGLSRPGYNVEALPETEEEISAAARLLRAEVAPPDVLLRENASRAMLERTDLSKYRIIHFATHAIASDDIAELREPVIVLSGEAGQGPQVLRAGEVAALRLTGCELVVLSACRTGVGEEVPGEGHCSLAWAFQQAGAKAVIMSLWDVPSVATARLFEEFYRRVAAGCSFVSSLDEARRLVRNEFGSPLFWGGFVLVGDEW